MNKFDTLIYDFLMQQKQVALEKMGLFEVTSETIHIHKGNESVSIPQIQFTFQRKATTSPELIAFIAERLGKNRLLVASDLESYFDQVRSFINLGKPYVIAHIGVLAFSKSGEYTFLQQNSELLLAEEKGQKHTNIYPTGAEQEQENRAKSKNRIAGLAIGVVLLIVAGIGWGVYALFFHQPGPTQEQAVTGQPDTLPTAAPATDSIVKKPAVVTDEVATGLASVTKDSAIYKFIFETTTLPQRAYSRTAQLRSFGDPARYDSSSKDGVITYRLYLRGKVALADTAKVRDSLHLYFQREIVAERVQ